MNSIKKGYPIQWSKPNSIFMSALINARASWTYNWNVSVDQGILNALVKSNINYCPCVWSDNFDINRGTKLHVKPKFIIGYNEPDQLKQANMDIERILQSWEGMSKLVPKDIILVGPSISDGVFSFRKRLYDALKHNGLRFDAIGLHYYRTDIDSFPRNDIPNLADIYGKPCVITEYGYMDWKNPKRVASFNDEQKYDATKKVINASYFFENCRDVLGYCIYPSYSASSYHGDKYNTFNMLEDNKLTDLYKEYADI